MEDATEFRVVDGFRGLEEVRGMLRAGKHVGMEKIGKYPVDVE